eukprot:scaffold1285_cov90-Skeletonema_dohrnii-CCMP3373.AAC.1
MPPVILKQLHGSYRQPWPIITPTTRILLLHRHLIGVQRCSGSQSRCRCCRVKGEIVIFTNGHKICQGLNERIDAEIFIPRPPSVDIDSLGLSGVVRVGRAIGGGGGIGGS